MNLFAQFEKVTITDRMEIHEEIEITQPTSTPKALILLRNFLSLQHRRAQAYAKLRDGFAGYMASRAESIYQQLCSEITMEFSDCSKQVRKIESQFLTPDCFREDLARLLRAVQEQEKQKLQLILDKSLFEDNYYHQVMTATIQVLKKAGRPSDRLVSHENCKFKQPMVHECVHVHELTDAAGTEEAEADAEYDNALNDAIKGVQDAVTSINELLEEVRYEIAALDSD